VSFTDGVQTALISKYVDFSGRARRSEYWWFALFNFLAGLIASVIDLALDTRIVEYVVTLGLFLPSLSVAARRLHDVGRTAWWLLLMLVPFLGWIALLIFWVMDSEPGDNRFGPNPKGLTRGFGSRPGL